MQAIYNTKTSIITRMIDTSEQNIGKYLNENEDYKQIPFSNDLSVGENINKFTDEGRLRPNSELVAENLITLAEDQILDGEVIRPLINSELVAKGLITLADDEILEDEVIRKLTEIEQIEMDLIPMPTDQEIIIDEEGNKSLQTIIDPIDKELQAVESEIKIMEDEALKSLIQERLEGKI